MATARHVLGKLKSSDGRIKIATASGVMAVVAALALVMVLPVSAAHVAPSEIPGNPDCTVLQPDDYLFEHKQDPPSSTTIPLEHNGLTGSVTVNVYNQGPNEKFDFQFSGDFVAAAVIVKGGDKANLYDYRPGGTDADTELQAPIRQGSRSFGLSHISFCVGELATVDFVCDDPKTLTGNGLITEVTAEIFANNDNPECITKQAIYTLEDDTVTLRFEGDGLLDATGRLDFWKDFGNMPFLDLTYDRDDSGDFQPLQWCDFRTKVVADGDQFDDVLDLRDELAPADTPYPSLSGVTDADGDDATACKVFEGENAAGIQHTVVYFKFEDPQFR